MKDLTVSRPFSEEDYNELLQQAVAVIETSRLRIAKQLNTIAMSSYWEIGKLLDERKVDTKPSTPFALSCMLHRYSTETQEQ